MQKSPPYQTKQQYVYSELRRMIQHGELRPGTWLAASELAKQFGVSAIPVREALRHLENEQLVDMQPHTRAVVKGVSRDDAIWVAELRLLLEPEAARRATKNVTDDALRHLEQLVEQMDRCVADQDPQAYSVLNHQFHHTIYSYCPNERLHALLNELWETAQRFALIYRLPGHLREGQEEHRLILRALKGGDPAKVGRAVHQHRTRILRKVRRWLDAPGSATQAE